MTESISELRLTLNVHKPFWLSTVTWLLIRIFSVAAFFGWEATDERCACFGRWYVNHLRITADPA